MPPVGHPDNAEHHVGVGRCHLHQPMRAHRAVGIRGREPGAVIGHTRTARVLESGCSGRADVARRYLRAYQSKGPGHNHIHGANMGFSAAAYWQVGGFKALPTGEDVDLVKRFEAAGMRIHRDATLSVATSDRRHGRAPGGFAQHLRSLRRKTPAST